MSIAVKSGLPSLGSTEGAVISADEVSVSEDGSAAASVGEDLPRGKSAYEIAKENGFDGTEAEWLASLKGATGAAGANGKDGENGKTPYVGDNGNWYIGADDTGKPSRGAKGEPGATPTLGVESVETGAPGTDAEVTMIGDAPNHALKFVIPRGDKGDKGDTGAPGTDGHTPVISASKTNGVTVIRADGEVIAAISDGAKGDKGDTGSPGAKGDKGDTGVTPNLTIGTVTTLEAGQDATASMGGTAESPVLNLGIPKGAKGEPGEGGGGGTYYVELNGNYPNYTLSETTPLTDIAAAYAAGKALFCRGYADGYFTIELPLFSAFSSSSVFIFSGSHCVDNTGALPENAMITIAVAESGVYCEHLEYLTEADARGAWYVTVTPNGNVGATADKTAAQVYAAYQSGYAVYCIAKNVFNGLPAILPLLAAIPTESDYMLCFAGSGAPRVETPAPFTATVTYNGGWFYFIDMLATKMSVEDMLTTSAIVTSASAESTDAQVPSAKAVYTFVTGKIGEIENGTY